MNANKKIPKNPNIFNCINCYQLTSNLNCYVIII